MEPSTAEAKSGAVAESSAGSHHAEVPGASVDLVMEMRHLLRGLDRFCAIQKGTAVGRDAAIARTHVEDALLRMSIGSPSR